MDGIQDYAPLYEWDNTANGKDADITTNDPWGCSSPSMQDHLKDGRDYKNDERMPGYLPLAYPHPLRRGICDIASLLDTLSGWKKGEKDIRTLMEAIAEWKSGC
jgi:hypothetical protein